MIPHRKGKEAFVEIQHKKCYMHSQIEYFQMNKAIHEKILAAAHNPTLANIYNSLAGRVSPARFRANMSKPRWAEAVEEHEKILKALENRDGKALSHLLKAHLANKRETVREALFSKE